MKTEVLQEDDNHVLGEEQEGFLILQGLADSFQLADIRQRQSTTELNIYSCGRERHLEVVIQNWRGSCMLEIPVLDFVLG